MISKYLKDQGGQFWGAFNQSLAKSISEERDRPLKEAMLKAQIGHQQALNDKAQMDIEQARQQQQAVTDLANILTPKVTTPAISEAPAQIPMAPSGNLPTLTPQTTTPDVKSPEVMSKLAKAQPKEFTTAILKQATNPALAGGAIVNTWEEARRLQNDPEFQAANPYGGRWQVNARGQIQFQGIHPVNPEAATFHGPGGAPAALNYAYNRGAASGAGGYAGRTAQEIQQPIQPMQPLPGQAGPNVGTSTQVPTSSTPGETPEMTKQRLRKQAQIGATPLPEEAAKQQTAAAKISAQADTILKGFSPEEIDKFAGVFNQPMQKGKSYLQAGAKALGMGSPVDQGERDRFSAWQVALAQLKQVAFDTGGKQLTPFEASVVFGYIPTGNELNGGTEIKQKIENLKTVLRAGADIRMKLAQQGRGNIDPAELDKIMQQELSPIVDKLKAGQPGGGKQQAGNIINYNGKQYIIQNGTLFQVK